VLYAQLMQTKNKQCKSAIILQCCCVHINLTSARDPQLAQPYNHAIHPGASKINLVFFCKHQLHYFWQTVQLFTILVNHAKENFLKSATSLYLLISGYNLYLAAVQVHTLSYNLVKILYALAIRLTS